MIFPRFQIVNIEGGVLHPRFDATKQKNLYFSNIIFLQIRNTRENTIATPQSRHESSRIKLQQTISSHERA